MYIHALHFACTFIYCRHSLCFAHGGSFICCERFHVTFECLITQVHRMSHVTTGYMSVHMIHLTIAISLIAYQFLLFWHAGCDTSFSYICYNTTSSPSLQHRLCLYPTVIAQKQRLSISL